MIYSLFGSPKKKAHNPEEQAIEANKAQIIGKVSQNLQMNGGLKQIDPEKEIQRTGTITHHRQIIEERKKKIASKEKVSVEVDQQKKKYLPSAQRPQMFFDPFSKGGNPKYSLNRNDKQKTQPSVSIQAPKTGEKQVSTESKNIEKTIVSSSAKQKSQNKDLETPKKRAITVVEQSPKKSSEINSPSQQNQGLSSIQSRSKQNIYTPNPKSQQKEEIKEIKTVEKTEIKTSSKLTKQVVSSQAVVESEKSQSSKKFERTSGAKSIHQKPKTAQVKDKNQKFIATSTKLQPIQLVISNKEQAKATVHSPKYSEVKKKQDQANFETPKAETKKNQQDDIPRIWNTTKSSYKNAYFSKQSVTTEKQLETPETDEKKVQSQKMNSPKAIKKEQVAKLVKEDVKQQNLQKKVDNEAFKKRQAKSPIFNATSPRNQETKQSSKGKKDQSCDKQLKRQSEAEFLKIQIEQTRKREKAIRQEQARKRKQKITADNLKRLQQAQALKVQLEQKRKTEQAERQQLVKKRKQEVEKRNAKSVGVEGNSIAVPVVNEQKNAQNNKLQSINQRKTNTQIIKEVKQIEKVQQTKKETLAPAKSQKYIKPVEKAAIQNKKQQISKTKITINQSVKQKAKTDRKNPQESPASDNKQISISFSQVSLSRKRHDHQYRQGSLRKSTQRDSLVGSPIKDIISKEKLIQLKHSRRDSITKQEYDQLMQKISHLQEYLQKNEEQLTAAHNDIIRKKQMLEDARQQIVDKNRLILELKYQQGPNGVIMPERFHYWSLDQSVFYRARDPVGQIVQQRRKAAFESRMINNQILSHSHVRLRDASRVSLREQTNSNLRNVKSQGTFKLNFSHGHPQQEQSVEASRMSSQRYNDDGEGNSQFYIGLLERLKSRVSILKKQNQSLQRGLIIR